jgi:RNA-binding protein YhbY
MISVLNATLAAAADPPSLAKLRAAAATHPLVLICDHDAIADGVVAKLRQALPAHRIVALTVASMSPDARELIQQVLAADMIPLIMIQDVRLAVRLTSWLSAEVTLGPSGGVQAA